MLIFYIISIVIIVILVLFFVNTYNQLIILRNNVDKAFANIDVLLKQRNDEVPNLVKVVKSTALYENSTLKELVNLRSQYQQSNSTSEKVEIAKTLDTELKSFFVLMEDYPELKATESYLQLQKRLSELEDMISDRREYFNESVNLYNIGIKVFPDVIFAKILNYAPMNMLKFKEEEKQLPEINL